MMISPGIRDILASFSPSSDLFAIASTDGRIKIWDTFRGQLKTEFSNFRAPSDGLEMQSEPKHRHLAFDYKCMKWILLESKKKKKHGSLLLVLGTGSGDVLSLEVSTGELRWRICDCHSGCISAIAFSRNNSFIYTAGLDGMVCQIDYLTGSIISKFRSSTKGISTLAVSPDGNVMAAAAGLLKLFDCADNKKIQKFSGHPVSVRCMIFSEDGKFIISSGVGERHIAIWKIDGGKKSASCILSMEHPAIFLDSRVSDIDGSKVQGLYVLALSEIGVCYFWYGGSIEELQNARPTMISSSDESSMSKRSNNQAIFSAKLDSIISSGSSSVCVAHGSLVKPSFEKLAVEYGVDINLNTSMDGVLLPVSQSYTSNKGKVAHATVTTLDSANAEDAIFPLPKLLIHEKKRKHGMPSPAVDFEKMKDLDTGKRMGSFLPIEVQMQGVEVDEAICIEDRLIAAGLLDVRSKLERKDFSNGVTDSAMQESLDFTVDVNLTRRKIRNQVSILRSDDACKLLEILVSTWIARSGSWKNLFPWIYYILVFHGQVIISQRYSGVLERLEKMSLRRHCILQMARLKSDAVHPLLKLSGRLQLMITQIDKAGPSQHELPSVGKSDDSDDDDDDDIDEEIYGGSDGSDSDN